MTRSLAWSYPYRERRRSRLFLPNQGMPFQPFPQPPQPNSNGSQAPFAKWKSAPPAIQDGKVVFTAWDADAIHCINLPTASRSGNGPVRRRERSIHGRRVSRPRVNRGQDQHSRVEPQGRHASSGRFTPAMCHRGREWRARQLIIFRSRRGNPGHRYRTGPDRRHNRCCGQGSAARKSRVL